MKTYIKYRHVSLLQVLNYLTVTLVPDPGFGGISRNDPDALQDLCNNVCIQAQDREGNLPLRQKKIFKQNFGAGPEL